MTTTLPDKLTERTIGGLKIERMADKRVEFLNMLLYGEPGVGKTTLIGTASKVAVMCPVLLLNVEGGDLSLGDYPGIESVRVNSYKQMQPIYDELYRMKHGFRTVAIDNLTELRYFSMGDVMVDAKATAKNPDNIDIDVPGQREWGKNAQPLDSPILTPDGWKRMGDLSIGDFVIGSKGLPVPVLAIHPQGTVQTYLVKFTDGTVIECSGEHLWELSGSSSTYRINRIIQTKEIPAKLNLTKWSAPIVKPIEFTPKELPVHPYILGMYLGDGCSFRTQVTIGSLSGETIPYVEKFLPEGHTIRRSGNTANWIINSSRRVNQWNEETNLVRLGLRTLNLWGVKTESKFVPREYLTGSVEQRLLLLQGIMDADGSVRKNAGAQINTISHLMANGIKELVQSLGGVCNIVEEPSRNGTGICLGTVSKSSFKLYFRLPKEFVPFLLQRKADSYKSGIYEIRRNILSVEVTNTTKEMQCLTVDSPDGLYVTNNYVLTHNSEQIRRVVRGFRDLPMHTIFTAHAKEEEQKNGLFKIKPSLPGKLADEVSGFVDLVLYYYMKLVGTDSKRLILTAKTAKENAKDRSGKLPTILEEPTMEMIMSYILPHLITPKES